jgi:hypothetical protein
MIKANRLIPGLGESICLTEGGMMQRFRGEEGPNTATSLTSQGEAGGTETIGGRLRNPFLKRPYFTGSFVFFAGGTTPVTLLRTRPTDNFEASRESDNNPSFHFTE